MSLKVVIIEDHKVLLHSFTEIVNSDAQLEVTGAYTNCESALLNFNHDNPDVLLIDVQLPGMDGIEGIKVFKKLKQNILPIIISVHEGSKYIFEALCAGAVGYLTKNVEPEELIRAILQANNGGAPMSSIIARKVVESFQFPKEKELTERENDVLKLLSQGKSYGAIAKELCLSINTIKTHTRNIYEKLHVNSKKEIIQKYGKA